MKEPRSAAVPVIMVLLVVFGLAGDPAQADEPIPSFDCKKAATPVEKTICEDAFTGFRDGALGKLYSGLVDSLTDRAGSPANPNTTNSTIMTGTQPSLFGEPL